MAEVAEREQIAEKAVTVESRKTQKGSTKLALDDSTFLP